MKGPIALFVFKRPEETRQTLEHLARNPGIGDIELFVFCDAARQPGEAAAVQAAREVVRSRSWCPRITIIERAENWGLARSIIAGVTQLVGSHGRVIVVEDDLLLARGFLNFMNAALDRYADSEQVMQISGHNFSIPASGGGPSPYFIPMIDTCGWATWKRAWDAFDPSCRGWERLSEDRALRSRFDLDGAYDFSRLLQGQMAGGNDAWGVRWRWAVFQRSGITLYPGKTLVKHIGWGNGATHTVQRVRWLETRDWDPELFINEFPEKAAVDAVRFEIFKAFFRINNQPPLLLRAIRKFGLYSAVLDGLFMRWALRKSPSGGGTPPASGHLQP